ncbi:unnamed protein product, partial [Lepidochelys olivacea]
VLWPRLLEYVVPAQYTGTLKLLCRCLRELAEKKQREGEAAACLDYSGTHTWSSQRSLELSRQMASYASPSKEMSFLYKALGMSLAACEDLVCVKSQIHTLLNSYRQQIIWKPLRD